MDPLELPTAMATQDTTRSSIPELMALLTSADSIADESQRDAALIEALRTVRKQMETAEAETAAARRRLENARQVYDAAAHYLAGGTRGDRVISNDAAYAKSTKFKFNNNNNSNKSYDNINPSEQLPTNPIVMPRSHTSGGGMDEIALYNHREAFYQQLLGLSPAQADQYVPNDKQPNLRSKSQLVEGMHIVQHWYTGADGLDVGAFRSRHKTWYTRMRPNSSSSNLGRRTGIHVRELSPTADSEGGETVLCRYSKDGSKSIVYLDVGSLYDALFEIHAVEYDHCGREVCKARVDELYANIPDGQVKLFLETCPVCAGRKDGGGGGTGMVLLGDC